MAAYTVSEIAELFAVSPDTVRRWISSGKLSAGVGEHGRQVVDGAELALWAQEQAPPSLTSTESSSARNRARGLVTRIVKDTVMAQVDLQCGPYRFVSLMSAEAVESLRLEVGDVADAVVKATTVIVERAK